LNRLCRATTLFAFVKLFCRASFDIFDVHLVWASLMTFETLWMLLSEFLPLDCTSFLQEDPQALSEQRNTRSSKPFSIATSSYAIWLNCFYTSSCSHLSLSFRRFLT
jgi:hypothetical protein